MAILSSCPGLVIEILVDGVPLQEYDDDENEQEQPDTVTKYIIAQSGAQFSIRFTASDDFSKYPFSKQVYLDGTRVRDTLFESTLNGNWCLDKGRMSKVGKQSVLQNYQFDKIIIVEGDAKSIDEGLLRKVSSIGIIKVAFQGARNIRKDDSRPKPKTLDILDSLPEKALKGEAKSHQVRLSEPQKAKPIPWSNWNDVGKGPFAIFQFKYRSRAALQALHILPKTPSPVPLEERPEEELSSEELRQLVESLKERKAVALKIKNEDLEKRKRLLSTGDDGDATDDFEITETRNKRQRHINPKEVIILD